MQHTPQTDSSLTFEQQIFCKSRPDFDRLQALGFCRSGQDYCYSVPFLDGDFRAEICVNQNGDVRGRVFETATDSEYANVHIRSQQGEFVNRVRDAYRAVLEKIREQGFAQNNFVGAQANRLAQKILYDYGDKPQFPWQQYPDFATFRDARTEKWYALIMRIDKSKLNLGKDEKGEVEIVNLKIAPDEIPMLIKQQGILPAYHMNKKHWISVLLDDSVGDEQLFSLLEKSYMFAQKGGRKTQSGNISQWIIPANPKYYDIENAFAAQSEILWKQGAGVKIGDTVYMYVAAPRSAILYRCVVLQTEIPYQGHNAPIKIKHLMKIRLLDRYAPTQFTFSLLKKFGVNAVRGPRSMPPALAEYIEKHQSL